MIFKEKNLTQDQFINFYYSYVHKQSLVSLAAWIIRILPEDDVKQMVENASYLEE